MLCQKTSNSSCEIFTITYATNLTYELNLEQPFYTGTHLRTTT